MGGFWSVGGSSRRAMQLNYAAPAPTRAPATASPMGTRIVFIIVELIPNFWSIVERFVEPDASNQPPERLLMRGMLPLVGLEAHARAWLSAKKGESRA